MNGSCLDPDVKDPINAAPTCKGANKTNNAKPFPYVPGHYDAVQRTDKKKGYDDCAQDPGETDINKSFSFSSSEQETEYTVHNSAGKEEKKYDGHGRDWASEHSVSATYWINRSISLARKVGDYLLKMNFYQLFQAAKMQEI